MSATCTSTSVSDVYMSSEQLEDVDEYDTFDFTHERESVLDFDKVVNNLTPYVDFIEFSEAERTALVTTFRDYDPDELNTQTRLCNSLKRRYSGVVSS
jgi:hypothetical protein